MARTKEERAPRETPPPGRYLRSKSGSTFEVKQCSHRTPDGQKLYRLECLDLKVKGSQEWTIAQLEAQGVKWYRRRPR